MRYPTLALAAGLLVMPALAGAQEPQETVWTTSAVYRPRAEVDHRFGDVTNFFVSHRARAGVGAAKENWSAYLEGQDVRVWGTEPNTLAHKPALDLHQGFVRFAPSKQFKLTAGRQEINFLNQRLVGAVDWNQVGRAFDAARVSGAYAQVSWDAFAGVISEATGRGNADYGAAGGVFAWDNAGRKLAAIGVADWEPGKNKHTRYTFGPYSEGKLLDPLTYRLEAYGQTGSRAGADLKAYFFSAEVGYGSPMLKAAAGYDRASGKDTRKGKTDGYTTFDTLYATNHKFYGMMDLFTVLPRDTGNQGLQDAYLSVTGIRGKASLTLTGHRFYTERPAGEYFGTEGDILCAYAFTKNVQAQVGYGALVAGTAFEKLHKRAPHVPNWGYSMVTAAF